MSKREITHIEHSKGMGKVNFKIWTLMEKVGEVYRLPSFILPNNFHALAQVA